MTSLAWIDPDDAVATVYLHPGQIFTTAEAVLVTTVLGSCIAVCLWDPVAGVAGMNHFLLPASPVRGANDLRYGNTAMERLFEAVTAKGAVPARLVAKVFGGASVIPGFTGRRHAIGAMNVAAARDALARNGTAISAEQTGGSRGRKLLFHTGHGAAYVKDI
jgi:chemotaxis protein CheD